MILIIDHREGTFAGEQPIPSKTPNKMIRVGFWVREERGCDKKEYLLRELKGEIIEITGVVVPDGGQLEIDMVRVKGALD